MPGVRATVNPARGAVVLKLVVDARESFCWHCGKQGDLLQRCGRCVREQMPLPATFCDRNCLAAAWPIHKRWHKQCAAASSRPLQDRDGVEIKTAEAEIYHGVYMDLVETSDYYTLTVRGAQLLDDRRYNNAYRTLEKAMRLAPEQPDAYYEAAECMASSGRVHEAVRLSTCALERSKEATIIWSQCVTFIFLTISYAEENGVRVQTRPGWWSHEGLKIMSAMALNAFTSLVGSHYDGLSACPKGHQSTAQHFASALRMRAMVLSLAYPSTAARGLGEIYVTRKEKFEAAKYFQLAARWTADARLKRQHIQTAVQFNQELQAQSATMGDYNPTLLLTGLDKWLPCETKQ